jgi:hypothetical protein
MAANQRHEIPGWLLMPVGVVVVSALLLTVPLWIPLVFVWDAQYRRRLRLAAEAFRCSTCGSTLGTAAVRRADEQWEAYVRELVRKNPGIRLRMVRLVHAVCVSCGTPYKYDDQERTFVVQSRGIPEAHDVGTLATPR